MVWNVELDSVSSFDFHCVYCSFCIMLFRLTFATFFLLVSTTVLYYFIDVSYHCFYLIEKIFWPSFRFSTNSRTLLLFLEIDKKI